MPNFLLYLICCLLLIRGASGETINQYNLEKIIDTKNKSIGYIKDSIKALEDRKPILDSQLNPCKKYNTLGNVASIVGTGLLFTPLFFVGLGASAIGAGTSIVSNIVESSIESSFRENLKDILEKEELAEKNYSRTVVEIFSGSSKGSLVFLKASDLKRMYDVGSGYKVAYNGVNGFSKAIKAGTKMSAAGKFLGVVGVGLSVADIIMTWRTESEISNFIKEKKEKLKAEEKKLKIWYEIRRIIKY